MNGVKRTARKEHRCSHLCGGVIEKGEVYWNEGCGPPDNSDNDTWFTWKAHLECRDAFYELAADCDGYFPDDPSMWLTEYLTEDAVDPQNGLHPAYLRVVEALGPEEMEHLPERFRVKATSVRESEGE